MEVHVHKNILPGDINPQSLVIEIQGVNSNPTAVLQDTVYCTQFTLLYMNKEKNLSPSQGLNLGLPNTSQMLLPLRHQDS